MVRQLIGSLVDSYGFKQEGLVKKTISVTVQGITHHLVSYYHVNDVVTSQLRTPGQMDSLQYIRPRAKLTQKQSFRAPIEEVDDVKGIQSAYACRMNTGGYLPQPQYYMPQNYPPMAQQPNQPHHPMGVPAMSAPIYAITRVGTTTYKDRGTTTAVYDQSGHNRSYESLNSSMPPKSKSIPPTPITMASVMPDCSQAQPPMYPPMSMQRPANNLSPVSVDPRNSVPYRPNPYPVSHPNAAYGP